MVDQVLELSAAAILRDLLSKDVVLAAEVARVRKCGNAVVFGGWVRDVVHAIIHSEVQNSRDFDIVVNGSLSRIMGSEINHFGGHRLHCSGELKIDCWELARTVAFARRLLPPSFPNLLSSTVYRLNGCFIDLQTLSLQGEGAIGDIRDRKISFNCIGYLDMYPEFQAFRAIDLRDRFGYALDEEVRRFVEFTLKNAGPARFADSVREHRKNEPIERLYWLFQKYAE